MGSKCVERLPHRTDKCNAANALQVFLNDDGTYTGFCFSCGQYEANPYGDKPAGYKPHIHVKSQEEIEEEIAEIREYRTTSLEDRKLKEEYLKYFDVKIGVSEVDGVTPTSHYYPYTKNGELISYKVRIIEDKRFWSVGNQKEVDLFGWSQAILTGAKKIFITEGELDAVALFQIMKEHNKGTQYADFNPAVVSLAHGSGSAVRDLAKALPEIRKVFKEIVLVFDNDEPGKKAVEGVMKIIPDAVVVTLPSKDANECIIQGRAKAAYNAATFNAQKPKNTRMVSGNEIHQQAKEPPKYGVSWPWKHVTEATRGIRLGETIYIGAGRWPA